MEKILERCAALDVHKRQVTACARVPDRHGERAELRAEFETMTPDLLALRDWLKGLGVTHVAMEATGVSGRAMLAELCGEIEGRLRPFGPEVELLCTIPGVAQRTAEVILAELGPDMSRFPTHRHAASWAAVCPGSDESAGKRRTGKTRQGDGWLRTALVEAANSAAGRTRGTYLNAQYNRIKRRRGHNKAIVAVAHSILVGAYYMLRDGVPYEDLGGDYFLNRERPERLTQHLVRQLERLGQRVTLEPVAEGAR
jgi:transposase